MEFLTKNSWTLKLNKLPAYESEPLFLVWYVHLRWLTYKAGSNSHCVCNLPQRGTKKVHLRGNKWEKLNTLVELSTTIVIHS